MKIRPINIHINGKPFKVYDEEMTAEEFADIGGYPLTDEQREWARRQKFVVKDGCSIDFSTKLYLTITRTRADIPGLRFVSIYAGLE